MKINLKSHDIDLNTKIGEKPKMITPRIPMALHHALAEEARSLGINQNELYIARLSSATVNSEIPSK